MDAGELDLGLNGQVGHHVGPQRPQPLSGHEFLARRRGICAVQGYAGLHRTDEWILDPGPLQNGGCLRGQALRPAPFTACHCQQRPFTQRLRENLVGTDLLRGAGAGGIVGHFWHNIGSA